MVRTRMISSPFSHPPLPPSSPQHSDLLTYRPPIPTCWPRTAFSLYNSLFCAWLIRPSPLLRSVPRPPCPIFPAAVKRDRCRTLFYPQTFSIFFCFSTAFPLLLLREIPTSTRPATKLSPVPALCPDTRSRGPTRIPFSVGASPHPSNRASWY